MPRNNLVRVKDRLPRDGKGVDNLLAQLGQYLRDPSNRLVQKIVVEAERLYIYFEKLVDKESASANETGISLSDVIRTVTMEEVSFPPDTSPTPIEYLFGMFNLVDSNGYDPCHLLVGKASSVHKWLGIPRATTKIFGVPVVVVPDIPVDVIILAGSRSRESDPEDIEYLVKGNI